MLVSTIKEKLRGIEEELAAQTDRGAAIIGSAIIDDFLSDALKRRLILTSDLRERLFEGNGPLANFSAKIDMAFAVGICDSNLRADLHYIRRIRNRFAHTPEPLRFSDEKISGWCSQFCTVTIDSADPRTRYLSLCSGISAFMATLSQAEIKLQDIRSVPAIREQIDLMFEQTMERALKSLEPLLKGP
jgi:DNA-binding MltR family transcriptional regulator